MLMPLASMYPSRITSYTVLSVATIAAKKKTKKKKSQKKVSKSNKTSLI